MATDAERSAQLRIDLIREMAAELDVTRPEETLATLKLLFGAGVSLKAWLRKIKAGQGR